jgi:hypothetical protein
MSDLDDESLYEKVLSVQVGKAFTYADTRPGCTDREKREEIRAAAKMMTDEIPECAWWAFRVSVKKAGGRAFDIENVPKLYIDAFCRKQIKQDGSSYPNLGLYEDDTIDHVRVLEVYGERIENRGDECTFVEVFARRKQERQSRLTPR